MDYSHLQHRSLPVGSLSASHSFPPSASAVGSSHLSTSQHGHGHHGSSSQIPISSDRHNPFREPALRHTLGQGQGHGSAIGGGNKKPRLAPSLSAHSTRSSSDDLSIGSGGSGGYAFHSPPGGGGGSGEDMRPTFRPGSGMIGGGAAPGRGGFGAPAQYNTNFFPGTPPPPTSGNFIPAGFDNFPSRPPSTSASRPTPGGFRPRGGSGSFDVYQQIMGSSSPQGPGSQAGSGPGTDLFNFLGGAEERGGGGGGNNVGGGAFGLDWPVHGTGKVSFTPFFLLLYCLLGKIWNCSTLYLSPIPLLYV